MADERTGAAGTIVTGYDGSAHADAALRYALAEGVRRNLPVRVITAYEPPQNWAFAYGVYTLPEPEEAREAFREEVRRQVDEVRSGLDEALRAVPVEVEAVLGPPAAVLIDAARGAELLVVGHRGRGGLRSAVLGSVGLSTVLHATCPVLIVPAEATEEARSVTTAAADR